MSQEITLHLTPQEAATGVTRIVNLESGPITIRIPPVQNGATVRVPTDQGDVLVRIQVTGAYAQTPGFGPPIPPKKAGANSSLIGCLVFVVIAVIIGIAVANSHHDDNNASDNTTTSGYSSGGDDSTSTSGDSTSTSGDLSTTGGSSSTSGDSTSTSGDSSSSTSGDTTDPGGAAGDQTVNPYYAGTCLNGTIPDSTTAVAVNDVSVVDCSASDAHYKVIKMFSDTTDMNQCDSVSDTQYEFSEDDTLNGITTNSYVYCLIGLGSYAQQ